MKASWRKRVQNAPGETIHNSKRLQPVTDKIVKEAAKLALEQQTRSTEANHVKDPDPEEPGVVEVLDPTCWSSYWEDRNRRAMLNW